jgi:hypothetical protein
MYGGDMHVNLDKNRRDRDARGYIDQRHREREEWELRRIWTTIASAAPGAVQHIMEREERDHHNIENR